MDIRKLIGSKESVPSIDFNQVVKSDNLRCKYDRIFVMEKRKDFFRRMIKNCDKRIEELKSK